MRARAQTANQLRAALSAIDKEAGTNAAAKAYLKMRLTHGVDRMSRRRFLEEAIQVQDKRSGEFGPWWLNTPQRATECIRLKTVRAGRLERYCTLKARKWGISTLWLGYGLEAAERIPNFQGAIVADNNDSAAALLHQGKQMRNRQPFKLVTKFDNRSQLYFASPLDSAIDIETAKSPDPLRGRTMRFVHATEPQLWDDAQRKRAAIENAVADRPGTVISYEGTGAGRNWWYEFWWAARKGHSDYTAIFLPWLMDRDFDYSVHATPEEIEQAVKTMTFNEEQLRLLGASWGQLLWRRKKIATVFEGNEKYFAQEYPATPEEAFMADGRPCFNPEGIDRAEKFCVEPTWRGDIATEGMREDSRGVVFNLVDDPRGALKVWERPIASRAYSIGSDTGHGIGQDNSVAYVMDNRTGLMVASFVCNTLEPRPFGKALCALGQSYNWAYVLPEIEGPGRATLDALKEFSYPRIGSRAIYDQAHRVSGIKLGFSTNVASRPILFNEIRANLQDYKGSTIRDIELCQEMHTMYRDEAGRECCPGGKKDDRVMAWGVTLMACRESKNPDAKQETFDLPAGSLEARHWAAYEAEVAEPKSDEDDSSW